MKKNFFLIWVVFILASYFFYFSPQSVYQLTQKKNLINELQTKNQKIQIENNSFRQKEISIEKKDFFVDMGYLERNQIIVDIKVPPLSEVEDSNPNYTDSSNISTFDEEDSLLSSVIFFFTLSCLVIIGFIAFYKKKTLFKHPILHHPPSQSQ